MMGEQPSLRNLENVLSEAGRLTWANRGNYFEALRTSFFKEAFDTFGAVATEDEV